MSPMSPAHNDDSVGDVKRFESLRAVAAMTGFELLRTDPQDGPVRYLGVRWGTVREIGSSLELVAGFVRVMRGAA